MEEKERLEKFKEDINEISEHIKRTQIDEEDKKRELDEIEHSIEFYSNELEDLRKKLEDESNYKIMISSSYADERPFVEELLEESFEKEEKELISLKEGNEELIEQTISIIEQSENQIDDLKKEIKDMQRLLRKDELAKERGIGKKLYLTEEQIENYKREIEVKEEELSKKEEEIKKYNENLDKYRSDIEETTKKLDEILSKKNRLEVIKENKKDIESDIDRYQIRLDEDKVAQLESGLEALKNRKEFLEFEPLKKLEEIISYIEESIKNIESNEIKQDEETLIGEKTEKVVKTEEEIIEKENSVEKPLDEKNSLLEEETIGSEIKLPVAIAETKNNEDESIDNKKPLYKVVNIKSATEFLKKHKKAILIAGGLTAVAILAQPVIIPVIMHANSVLWHASFVQAVPALQGFLHGCNLFLGNAIGASYAGATGVWTAATGAVINAEVAKASILAALTTHAISIGAIGVAAKKLINKIKGLSVSKVEEQSNDENTKGIMTNVKEKLEKVKNTLSNITVDDELLIENGGNTL